MAKQTTAGPREPQTSAADLAAEAPVRRDPRAEVQLSRASIARLIQRHREALERLARR